MAFLSLLERKQDEEMSKHAHFTRKVRTCSLADMKNIAALLLISCLLLATLLQSYPHIILKHHNFVSVKSKELSYEFAANLTLTESLQKKISKYSKDNLIVLTICNKGMAFEWLQQWYVSARKAGVHNILVIATDREAYEWIFDNVGDRAVDASSWKMLSASKRWNSKLRRKEENNSVAFNWRSFGYENIVVQRATLLKNVLQKTSVNILYSDTDVHWMRDPTSVILKKYSTYNLCLQREKGDELGDYNCSGVIFLSNSLVTLKFLRLWESYIRKRMLKEGFFTDQEEVNHLLLDFGSRKNVREIEDLFSSNFSACTFDWDEFPSGINFFSHRRRGKGRIEKNCKSRICKSTIWVPISQKGRRDMSSKAAFLVHHNYAKSNKIKIERAKEYGLWLDMEVSDWYER